MAPGAVENPHPVQWIDVAGIAGYITNIKDTIQHDFACRQVQRFHDATETMKTEIGALPPVIHESCWSVALLFGKAEFTFA
jgi:hypothetical protein